jgi:hypothetical protein
MQEIDNQDNELAKFFENWTSPVFSTIARKWPKPLDRKGFTGNCRLAILFPEKFVDKKIILKREIHI